MGGFLGLGGNSKIDKGMSGANNIFNTGMDMSGDLSKAGFGTTNTGLDTMKTGLSSLDEAKDFFGKIMSGNRPAQFAAVAPEINTINAQSDAQRTQAANLGTARGGGVAGASADAETSRMKSIDDMLFGARTGAANSTERIGTEQAQIGQAQANVGMEQLSAALRALGLSDEAIAHYTEAALGRKQQNTEGWKNLMKLIGGGPAAFAK
jgi:hypothetical protein